MGNYNTMLLRNLSSLESQLVKSLFNNIYSSNCLSMASGDIKRNGAEEWSKTGTCLTRPNNGWIHPSGDLESEHGVYYGVRVSSKDSYTNLQQ